MLTHTRRHAIESEETQVAELGGIAAIGSSVATACYSDRDPVFHLMGGSFQCWLGSKARLECACAR